jgi:outer membrane protein
MMTFLRSNIVYKTSILIPLLLLAGTLAFGLTLDEAKQIALSKNSKYLAQKDAYQSSKWSKQQALGGMLPSLTLTGSYLYQDPAVSYQAGPTAISLNPDTRNLALNLSQPIFMGGKLWQSYQITGITEELNRYALENMRLSIVNEVETKYLAVLQLQELLNISVNDLQRSKNSQDIAKVRFDSGIMSSPDYLRTQANTANKEVAMIQSQSALELARQDLMNTLKSTELSELEPLNLASEEARLTRLSLYTTDQTRTFTDRAIQRAGTQNYALKTAMTGTRLSGKAYNIARGAFLPTVMLTASRSFNDMLKRYDFDVQKTLVLSFSMPLFPLWNTYSGSRKAWYDYQKSQQDYQTASDGINLGVRANALNLISSARQVAAARIALQYTELTYQQMQERFRNNLLSVTDMLDVEVMLQSTQVSLNNAIYSYLKTRSALLQALGTDNINDIDSLME